MIKLEVEADGVSVPMESDRDIALFSHPITSAYGASLRVRHLFSEIEKHHGTDIARQIFQEQARPTRAKRQRDWLLLERLDRMPEPHPYVLARELAEENRKLPRERRHGTRTTSLKAMWKHVQRLIKEREHAVSAGRWTGPGADERGVAGAVLTISAE